MNPQTLRLVHVLFISLLLIVPAHVFAGFAVLETKGDWVEKESGRSLERHFRFANENVAYGLTYNIHVPADAEPGTCESRLWAFRSGTITLGMTEPTAANWYRQGFFSIKVDGVSLHDIQADFRVVQASGAVAMLEGVWKTPKGPVLLRLALRANDDKLLAQIMLPPETEAKKLEVRMTAYPQSFAEPRARRMFTASRQLEASTTVDLKANDESWAVFYDAKAQKRGAGGGPCGFVYLPAEVQSARVALGSYAVNTTLKAKPGGRTVTVGLWDYSLYDHLNRIGSALQEGTTQLNEDLQQVAAADWAGGELPAPRVPDALANAYDEMIAERRVPTPYDQMSSEIVTPHVPWARPLADGPIRTLVVAPRWAQRETVELAQRLDMDYTTVCFSASDQVLESRWLELYGSYELYGYPKKTPSDILFMLAEQLESEHDCIVLANIDPDTIPAGIRKRLIGRVKGGAGLVLSGQALGLLKEFGESLEDVEWQPGVVPVAHLPRLRELVEGERPITKAYTFGQGRVMALHFPVSRNVCLTPALGSDDPDVLGYYDYFHSLTASAVLWTAGRDLPVDVRFADDGRTAILHSTTSLANSVIEVRVNDPARDFSGRIQTEVNLPPGEYQHTLPPLGPASGPRFVSVRVLDGENVVGWGTTHLELATDRWKIEQLTLSQPAVPSGDVVRGTLRLSQVPPSLSIELEVSDCLGRVLARKQMHPESAVVEFETPLCMPLGLLCKVTARLLEEDRLLDQAVAEFASPDRSLGDFHFLVWSNGGNSAVRHHINRQLARGGVDWIDNTGLTGGDRRRTESSCRRAAMYNLKSVPYITRIASLQETGRVRRPCLNDPEHLESWTDGLTERATGAAAYAPPAYTLGDENFLVRGDLDVCTSSHCLAQFSTFLSDEYGSIDKLNPAWNSAHKTWEDALPATFDEVKENPEHWPRWADHRRFMDTVFTRAHARGRDAVRDGDPGARVGFDGVFSLNSWHGYDFYQLCKTCDLVQVYAQRPWQIEYLRTWRMPDAVAGSWYNGLGNRNPTCARWLGWHLLLHRFNGSWYWTSYNTGPALLFPDLRAAPQFTWMQETHEEISRGIGTLLLAGQREHDGIAVHYSQPSVHAGTLTGRAHAKAQWGMARLVEDLGLQYNMLSYQEIEEGSLADYQLLLMPASTALSSEEAAAIRHFVEQGGTVIADSLPGILDEHCRLLPNGQLDELFGVSRSGLPTPAGEARIVLEKQKSPAELPLAAHDAEIESRGAEAWGRAGEVPCVLTHTVGSGHTVLLNTRMEAYDQLRRGDESPPIRELGRRLLELAGISGPVKLKSDGKPVGDSEIVRFRDGDLEYVALVKDPLSQNNQSQQVEVSLPRAAWLYNVRESKPLGRASTATVRLSPGDPVILALLPKKVSAIQLNAASETVAAGDPIRLTATLTVDGEKLSGRHCLHVHVLGPDGTARRHYARNVLTEAPQAAIEVPLALNDPPGRWQIRVQDVATGHAAELDVLVTQR